MNTTKKLRRLLALSPTVAFSKIWEIFFRNFKFSKQRKIDLNQTTYSPLPVELNQTLYSYFKLPLIENLEKFSNSILYNVNNLLQHKFNLLGSGWIHNFWGLEPTGIENIKFENTEKPFLKYSWFDSHINISNIENSMKIFEDIVDDYNLIDWQTDIKSGYRWKESTFYKDIQNGNIKGADIKVPWELGRMQHLPQLAYAALLANNKKTGFVETIYYIYEFRNEILDFISCNPPCFGVQWSNSMEAAIRAVNWLVTYDMFSQIPVIFDDEFLSHFKQSIYEHGRFIIENLEWSSGMRGNHYLAGIAGLLFISAYLPVTEETTSWLAFAVQELCNEILYQFLPDGGNFEASTCYHYFSTEILFYSLYIVLSLPEEKIQSLKNYKSGSWKGKKNLYPLNKQKYNIENLQIHFDKEISDRIQAISDFSFSILNPNHSPAQIGDNDSGRFLKLIPIDDFKQEGNSNALPYSWHNNKSEILDVISILSENGKKQYTILGDIFKPTTKLPIKLNKLYNSINENSSLSIEQKSFPDFGIFIYKSDNYQCTVRCGSIGQKGKGGHSHNDQLSLTLNIKGIDFIVDAGTYAYTPFPKLRNNYRSTLMHNTLSVDELEQNPFSNDSVEDLFWIDKDKTKSIVLQCSDNAFSGIHYGFPKPHKRVMNFNTNLIDGHDECNIDNIKKLSFHIAPEINIIQIEPNNRIELGFDSITVELTTDSGKFEIEDYNFSPAYGILQKSKVIRLITEKNQISWQIKINNL